MEGEIGKKLDEIAKKLDEENKTKELKKRQQEEEKLRLNQESQQEKENILKEIKKELSEFEPKLLPLRRSMLDPHEFSNAWNTKFSIVATEDRRIVVSASGRHNSNSNIYSLAEVPELEPYILDILRFFLIRLKHFEKYYVDNVEKHLK